MTTPFNEPTNSDPPDPSTQSLRQRAGDAWTASGQSGVWNAAKFGYKFGKNEAQQGQPTAADDGGWGSVGGNNGDDDYARKSDVEASHNSLSEQIGGIQGGAAQPGAGGMQDRNNAFGGGGSQTPQAPRPNVMADMADHNSRMLGQMSDSHSYLQNQRDRSAMNNANRTAQTASVAAPTTSAGLMNRSQMQSSGGITGITGSGVGASSGQNEQTMSGLVGQGNVGGNGSSESTWANMKWRQ